MKNVEQINRCYFCGTLVEVKNQKEVVIKNGRNAGKNAISTTIIIKSVLGGEDNPTEVTTELSSFAMEETKNGKPNPAYKQMKDIYNLVGKRVYTTASIEDNRFYSVRTNQLVPNNRFRFSFINEARADKADAATFEFSGFVKRPIEEKLDADNNLEKYVITLAQANYNKNNLIVAKFTIPKDNKKAVEYMEKQYTKYQTVSIQGVYSTKVKVIQKTDDNDGGFGEPITKTYNNIVKDLVIVHGAPVITGDTAYTESDIVTLAKAYNDKGQELKEAGENESNVPVKAPEVEGHLKNNESKFSGLDDLL